MSCERDVMSQGNGLPPTNPPQARGFPRKKGRLSRLWPYIVTAAVIVFVLVSIDKLSAMYYQTSNDKATPRNAGDVVKFIPKHVTFELSGNLGGGGEATYLDVNAQPHDVELTELPWTLTETTTLTAVSATIVANVKGDKLSCRILVDGVQRAEQSLTNDGAAVTCVVLSA
jgi:hypothetical protein